MNLEKMKIIIDILILIMCNINYYYNINIQRLKKNAEVCS